MAGDESLDGSVGYQLARVYLGNISSDRCYQGRLLAGVSSTCDEMKVGRLDPNDLSRWRDGWDAGGECVREREVKEGGRVLTSVDWRRWGCSSPIFVCRWRRWVKIIPALPSPRFLPVYNLRSSPSSIFVSSFFFAQFLLGGEDISRRLNVYDASLHFRELGRHQDRQLLVRPRLSGMGKDPFTPSPLMDTGAQHVSTP